MVFVSTLMVPLIVYAQGVNYPSQCRDYKTLSEASRHYTQPTNDYCDLTPYGDMSPQWSGDGWYRFTGAAGTKMATKREVTKRGICGTNLAGHLDTDGHPDLAEGQSQDLKACFYYTSQCFESKTVTIQRCDGFYVYKLPNVYTCHGRYCGAGKKS